jgi:hypothetical protein
MVISGVADRMPEKVASLAYLDAFVPENGDSNLSLLPPGLRLATVPGEDWLVAPPTLATFGLKRPEVIALLQRKCTPHPLATLTQPLQLTGGIGSVRQKMYILGTEPARFTRFLRQGEERSGLDGAHLALHYVHAARNARRSHSHPAEGHSLVMWQLRC